MKTKYPLLICALLLTILAGVAQCEEPDIEDILPRIEHPDKNPHITDSVKRVEQALKNTLDDYRTRMLHERARDITMGPNMARMAELLCHPQSPRKGDPELVQPLQRRLYATANTVLHGKDRNKYGFGTADVMRAYAIILKVRPELISDELRDLCLKSFKVAVEDIIKKNPQFFREDSTGSWVNGDIRIIEALMWAGVLLDEPRYTKAGEKGLEYVSRSFLPDGGFLYVGTINDTFTYHVSIIRSLAKFDKTFGSKLAKDLIVKSRFYYPLSIEATGVAEYSTAACWKPYWNKTTGSVGAEIVAHYTGCRLNKQVAGYWVYGANLFTASFYQKDLKGELKDGYVAYDYNIGGPRGRFGRWSFSGTAREYGTDLRGKGTFSGCMILDPPEKAKDHWNLNAAFHEAGVEIRRKPASEGYSRLTHHSSMGGDLYYSIGYDDKNGTTVGENCAALGTVYRLCRYKGEPQPCIGRQSWLYTRGRIVGLIEIMPEQDLQAYSLSATFKLVSGRAHWGTRKILEKQGKGYAYGDLRILIHDHTFGDAAIRYEDTYSGDTKKTARLSLLDKEGYANKEEKLNRYEKGVTRYALVEVCPDSRSPAADVIRHETVDGIRSFTVQEDGRSYRVWHNASDAEKTVEIASRHPTQLLLNGNKYRPEWLDVKKEGAADKIEKLPAGKHHVTIPAYGVILSHSGPTR